MQIEKWHLCAAAIVILYTWVSAHRRRTKKGETWDYHSGTVETNRSPTEVANDFQRQHRSAGSEVDMHRTGRGFIATVVDRLGGLFHIEVKAERRKK